MVTVIVSEKLNDSKNYKVLAKGLVNQTNREKLISEKTVNWLKNESPRASQFYLSAKILKECNPGPPVASSINCHTADISNTLLCKRHQLLYQQN